MVLMADRWDCTCCRTWAEVNVDGVVVVVAVDTGVWGAVLPYGVVAVDGEYELYACGLYVYWVVGYCEYE